MIDLVFQQRNGRISGYIDRHCDASRSPKLGKELLRLPITEAESREPVSELARKFAGRITNATD